VLLLADESNQVFGQMSALNDMSLLTLPKGRIYTLTALVVAVVVVGAPQAEAQWLVAPTPANQVSVTVTPTVTYDPVSGLYQYEYAIANASSSAQKVTTFALRLASAGTAGPHPLGGTAQLDWIPGRRGLPLHDRG
jgi:hypothetical protein